jgi:hypothetical protein
MLGIDSLEFINIKFTVMAAGTIPVYSRFSAAFRVAVLPTSTPINYSEANSPTLSFKK